MNYKKIVYSEPVEVNFIKCDFPGCECESSCFIDNPHWSGYKGRSFCKSHFSIGQFLIDYGDNKLWVQHKLEVNNKVVGVILEILTAGHYKVQWYFEGKELSKPEIYHASVLTLLPFKI